MYAQFAKFYDLIPLVDVMPAVREAMRQHDGPIRNVLDLGCGTGTFLVELADQGIAGTGIDISEAMIAAAQSKASQTTLKEPVTFRVADMADVACEDAYDFVTSTRDTINHVLSEEGVRRTFLAAYRQLRANGRFLFDMHTAVGLRHWVFQRNMHGEELVRFWHGVFDEHTHSGTLNIDAFVRLDSRAPLYTRYRVTLHERAYPMASVLDWLGEAGFRDAIPVGPSRGRSADELEAHSRAFICAVK